MPYQTDEWSNGKGTLSGRVAHVRRNESLCDVDRRRHPYVLIVNLAFQSAGDDGLPTDDAELTAADAAEQAIADRLESDHGALVGMMVTSDGTRDVFFFLPGPPDEAELEDLVGSLAPSFDFDFSVHADPNWEPYTYMGQLAARG